MAQGKRQTPARKPSSKRSAAGKGSAAGKRSATGGRSATGKRSAARKRSSSSSERTFVESLREPRVAATIGVVLAAAIIALLVLGGGDDGSDTDGARGPEEVSVEELQELPGSVDHAVYWAGERPDTRYELTVSEDGNILIRYLEPDMEVGSREAVAAAFTVGTYPVPDAYGALRAVADDPGAIKARTPDGALVLTNESNLQSVYIAYLGTDYQIEVYDPDGATALRAATSGQISPIE